MERDEKTVMLNSYSLLQDRYFEHMRAAGFDGFKRGERGSTAEHLDVLDFKIQQDNERLAAVSAKVEKKEARLDRLDEQITVREKAKATIAEVDAIGKLTPFGNFSMSADELTKLKTLAKKSVNADKKITEARKRQKAAEAERDTAEQEGDELKSQITAMKKAQPTIKEHTTWFGKFMAAMKRAPKRLMAVIEDILRQPPEQPEPENDRRRKTQEVSP